MPVGIARLPAIRAAAVVADPTPDAAIAQRVLRLSSAYLVRALPLFTIGYGARVDGIIGLTILAANTDHLTATSEEGRRYGGYYALPSDEVRRPISIARVADSAHLPFETARRHVHRLMLRNACTRREDGVIIPAAFVARLDPGAYRNMSYTRQLLRALETAGLVAETPFESGLSPADDDAVARLVSRATVGYMLRVLQLLADVYGDIRTGIIAQTIYSANGAHLDGHDGEGWRYAALDQTVPHELLKPVSVMSLADLLGVPYETMRGQTHRLIDAGVCVQADRGLIVARETLETPAALGAILKNVGYVRKLVRDLQAIGFGPMARQDAQALRERRAPERAP